MLDRMRRARFQNGEIPYRMATLRMRTRSNSIAQLSVLANRQFGRDIHAHAIHNERHRRSDVCIGRSHVQSVFVAGLSVVWGGHSHRVCVWGVRGHIRRGMAGLAEVGQCQVR